MSPNPVTPTSDAVLTVAEAAAFLRVSTKTMREMARERRLPCQKVGREWRFLRSALEAWVSGGGPARAPEPPPGNSAVSEPATQYALPLGGFSDTAFTDNRTRLLHRWVPWIAGFSGSFVEDVIVACSPNGRPLHILDPFAGVGTTLVEAIQRGHSATGFEINPYAALASRIKCQAATFALDELDWTIDRLDEFAEEEAWRATPPASVPPPGFRSRVPFFSESIEPQVLACMDFIEQGPTEWVRDLLRLALGSVMVGFSNYSYEPSLGTRAGAGKPNIDHADVFAVVRGKLAEIRDDVAAFQDHLSRLRRVPAATVHPCSFMANGSRVKSGTVDLVITSPPYLNNYHYLRNTRPQLYWLHLVRDISDVKAIERESFGQFWQTVRSGPEIPLAPRLPELEEQLSQLRKRNVERGTYGGPGWANYAATYFNDCQRFCLTLRPLMRPGGRLMVVIGNSILQGIEFRTDRLFADIAAMEGFDVVRIHEVRSKRTGNSVVNSAVRVGTVARPMRLYETAVELKC